MQYQYLVQIYNLKLILILSYSFLCDVIFHFLMLCFTNSNDVIFSSFFSFKQDVTWRRGLNVFGCVYFCVSNVWLCKCISVVSCNQLILQLYHVHLLYIHFIKFTVCKSINYSKLQGFSGNLTENPCRFWHNLFDLLVLDAVQLCTRFGFQTFVSVRHTQVLCGQNTLLAY